MEQKTNKTAGIFVVAGVGLLLLLLFLVGGQGKLFTASYHLNVKLDQVQGLNEGSVVQLAGLQVGNVENIIFNEKGDLIVQLDISKEYQNRITEGSTASLRTQGALGDKFVYIHPGPIEERVLKNGDYLKAKERTDIFSALSNKSDQVEYVFEILKDTRDIIRDIKGEGELKEAILNLRQASRTLNRFTKDMAQGGSGKEINESINKLNQILSKVDRGGGTLGALINDPSLYNKLNQWLGGDQLNPIKSAIRDSIQEREKIKP